MAIIEQAFSCMKGSMTIRGKEFYDEEKKGILKPVIISHGFTADMGRSLPYALFLAQLGWHTSLTSAEEVSIPSATVHSMTI